MKLMRITTGLLLISPFTCIAQANSPAPFTIAISAPTTVTAGQGILVHVVLTNTSDHKIFPPVPKVRHHAEQSYTVELRGPDGTIPPLTKYGRDVENRIYSPEMMGIQGPGQQLIDDADISAMYDTSVPGNYTLQLSRPCSDVSRPCSDDPKDGVVKSNEITITVVPATAKQ